MSTPEMRNVGTIERPKSWLHERAVALIYDELRRGEHTPSYTGIREGRPVCVKRSNGEWTDNLNEGVQEVVIPGEWDQVGGIVPDLILYGDKREPVRIIEVIVTSPPSPEKRRKLEQLARRGVDVVYVEVRTERDLFGLVRGNANEFAWTSLVSHDVKNRGRHDVFYRRQRSANNTVRELMHALQACEPEVRREFVELCRQMSSLNALYPLRPDNPLKDTLEVDAATKEQKPRK